MDKEKDTELKFTESVYGYVGSFIVAFGVIFGMKYLKNEFFPDQNLKFLKTIKAYYDRNAGKVSGFEVVSEKPITSLKEEIIWRKLINLTAKFYNQYNEKIAFCLSLIANENGEKLKSNLPSCAKSSNKAHQDFKLLKARRKSLFKEYNISSDSSKSHQEEFYFSIKNVFSILEKGNLDEKDAKDLKDNLRKVVTSANESSSKLEKFQTYLKKNTAIEVKSSDVALATALSLIRRGR